MNIECAISREISPFFKFANSENPSKPIGTWIDSSQRARVHLVYENCVSCNTKRFTTEEISQLKIGTDTYFCQPCFKKMAEVLKKYYTAKTADESEIFHKLWNDTLFGRRNKL
ncbi:MAG: hypothetical protein H0X29_07265 [Parachlamydiaceae bacterium]|nr:hypothetical protein [Parachlamydiaceae bacterium]